MSRRPARFSEADMRRVLAAAKKAGVACRVEITVDGKITVITGPASEAVAVANNPWDGLLHGAEDQKRSA
jgi:hypothetical protein